MNIICRCLHASRIYQGIIVCSFKERESDLRAFWLDLGWKMFQAEDTTRLKCIATFPIAKPTKVKRESLKKAMG